MFDLYGLTDGISGNDPNRKIKLCNRLIEQTNKMSGQELSSILTSYNIDLVVPGIVLEFKIPLTTETLQRYFALTRYGLNSETDKKEIEEGVIKAIETSLK